MAKMFHSNDVASVKTHYVPAGVQNAKGNVEFLMRRRARADRRIRRAL